MVEKQSTLGPKVILCLVMGSCTLRAEIKCCLELLGVPALLFDTLCHIFDTLCQFY